MEVRNPEGKPRPFKGKKIGGKHKKMGKKPVLKRKKKESKSAKLRADIDCLTAQYEAIDPKNIKKFR